MTLRTPILLGAVCLCACSNLPDPYAPPEQRQPFDHFEPYRIRRLVDMADPDAGQHIVRDILGQTGSWRWTAKQPEVRLTIRTNQMLHFVIDFTIVQAILKETGPLTLTFFVNGRQLDRVTYATEGARHLDEPVPADWVQPNQEMLLGAETDKVWYSPLDRQALGFIISRIGLTQE